MKVIDLQLARRLETCVQRAGGQKALAHVTHISIPQVSRYTKGVTAIPANRLMAIAQAANVHPYWLMTGEGAPDIPPIRAFLPKDDLVLDSDTLGECLYLAENLDREYGLQLSPSFKADFVVALYQGLYLESKLYDREMTFEPSKALEIFAYLNAAQGDIPRKMILNTISIMDGTSKGKIPSKEIRTFANYVSNAMRLIYDHPNAGRHYFDRIGYTLEPDTVEFLAGMLAEVKKSFMFKDKIDTLDLGCGNGRHLLHFSQFPVFNLKGVDNIEFAKRSCLAYEASGKLPKGTYVEGDLRSLPFPDNSFDFIFSNASIFHTPYFPESPHGLNEVFKEMLRVLRPKGYLYIHARHGNGYEPFPFFQLHNEGSMRQLAHDHGLQMKWFKKFFLQDSVECIPKTLFNDWFSTLLRKP